MKKIFFTLMFVLGGIAHAEQQPPAQGEVVEFDTCFTVLTCQLKNPQQIPAGMKDLECDMQKVSTEKMSVTLEPSRDHQSVLIGKLELAKEEHGFKHVGKVVVGKDLSKQSKNYGFMVEESFFRADEEMPSELDRTYGAVRLNLPSELNDVAFIGKIKVVDDKFLIPVLGIAAAGTAPQMDVENFNPTF